MYGEGIIERLHEDCSLRDVNNPVRHILLNTIGEWLDNHDTEALLEGVYLQSAKGKYLDLFGKDFGINRRLDEGDEHYRNRLIYQSLGYLTIDYLVNVYDLPLYVYTDGFNVMDNTLTSDNHLMDTGRFLSIADDDIKKILSNTFILGSGLYWINDLGSADYIMIDSVNQILEFAEIYGLGILKDYFYGNTDISSVSLNLDNCTSAYNLFRDCTGLTSVKLNFPNCINVGYLFRGCTGLASVDLTLPKADRCTEMLRDTAVTVLDLSLPLATGCRGLLRYCSSLTSVTLNIPSVTDYLYIFDDCSDLEYINVNVPVSVADDFITYVLAYNFEDLSTFIVNGEEVEL